MSPIRMHIFVEKRYHRAWLRRLREVCTQYGMERSAYRCKTYWKMPEKYEMAVELTPATALPFDQWEQIFSALFLQAPQVEFDSFNDDPTCNLIHYTPYRAPGEPVPEEYFVIFSIPESCISDLEDRFPNYT